MHTRIVRLLPFATVFIMLLAVMAAMVMQHTVLSASSEALPNEDDARTSLSVSGSALPEPTHSAHIKNNESDTPALSGVQGVVNLKVSMPTYIQAGEAIQYTYAYTNTGATEVSDMEIELKWVNFALEPTTDLTIYQFCQDDCGILEDSVVGPAVTMKQAVNEKGVGRVTIGTLAAGTSGSFSIMMTSNKAVFPRTNESIIRPSGSGRLFMGGSNQPTSEDTNNTMVVGPVLSVVKKATSTNKIYPLRDANFTLTIGNATGDGDTVDGHIRGDAREATGIVVVDTFPAGSDFVKATGKYEVNTTNKTVTWTIDETLTPGQSHSVQVTYKKLDVAESCDTVRNTNYTITSNEMPYKDDEETQRYTVDGKAVASIGLVQPLVVKSIAPTTANLPVGDPTVITIVVQNFYDTAINGAELEYSLPTDVLYTAANPPAKHIPTSGTPGGTITWEFDMAAGSIGEPTEKSFTINVQGLFTEENSNGTATLRAPSPVPSACFKQTVGGSIKLIPRLTVRKYTDSASLLVMRDDIFPYRVEIANKSSQPVSGVSLVDIMPGEAAKNACFTYVDGSATIDGTAAVPTKGGDGCGTLTWKNLTIPANGSITLAYQLKVHGHYFVTYCNSVLASRENETITHAEDTVCVKIHPNFDLQKNVSPSITSPGEEVVYTVRLTNRETDSYTVGLYDLLSEDVSFVRHVSGYAQPLVNGEELLWKRVVLETNQSIEVSFAARMPGGCYKTKTFENLALFQIESLGEVIIVRREPELKAKVVVNQPPGCVPAATATPIPTPTPTWDPRLPTPTPEPKAIRATLAADRDDVSLKDRVFYTITLENRNSLEEADQVWVDTVLPEGFIFAEVDPESTITSRPRIEKTEYNETRLTWHIPKILAGEVITIRYKALSSDVVGQYINTLQVKLPDDWSLDSNETPSVTTMVKPLMTIAPSVVGGSQGCQQSGAVADYQVILLNTNTHSYMTTTVVMHMPLGLSYVGVGTSTNPPDSIETTMDGQTSLLWKNVTIPERPKGQAFTQVMFEVKLQVGEVWDTLQVTAEATSPDGLIPPKDDVVDAVVKVCSPEQPELGKDSNFVLLKREDEYIPYILTLVNPTTAPIVGVTLHDGLPAGMEYVKMIAGAEPEQGTEPNSLVWSNLVVPAGDGTNFGKLELVYQVKVLNWEKGKIYNNTANIVVPQQVFAPENAEKKIEAVDDPPSVIEDGFSVYLPVVQRQ
jgi:uncharacterized repeat protein (TIGR01451 family)